MTNGQKELIEFGAFRLDVPERRLWRDGELVTLTPKTFDLLLILVSEPGRLLEKPALLQALWPDSFVEENNLADNISRLRKALGEGEAGCKYIETVPKRGYRFVAEIRTPPPAPEPSGSEPAPVPKPARRRFGWALAATLSTLALLAAAGLWLGFSMTRRAEREKREFRGDFLVTRWTEPEIRRGIQQFKEAVALDPTSASAHSGLVTGWLMLADLHASPREVIPLAQASLARALELDPGYAPAHVSLALVKHQYEWDWTGAEQEFRRAIALDPKHLPSHTLHGWFLTAEGRFQEAEAALHHTLQADPLNDFGQWTLGLAYYHQRRYDDAAEQYRRALGIDPRSYWPHMLLGWALSQKGLHPAALDSLREALRLNDNPQVLASLAHAQAVAGNAVEARKLLADLLTAAKRRYVSPYDLATVHASLGDIPAALASLEQAEEHRCGWLPLWLRHDPKFDSLRQEPRFQLLCSRIGPKP